MRRFQVSVNGKQYVVEVEELANDTAGQDGARARPRAAAKPAPLRAAADAPAPAMRPAADPGSEALQTVQGEAEGQAIKAPLRGQILRVIVQPGDKVQRGQVLLTIEALKLENEIPSPVTGVVTGVFAQPGSMVEAGATLVTVLEQEGK